MNRCCSVLLAVPLLLVACDEDLTDLSGLEARLEVMPESVDFGAVQVGDQSVRQVFLRNTGTAALELSGAEGPDFAEDSYEFVLDTRVVPPSGVAVLDVRFAPDRLGAVPSTIRIGTNERDRNQVDLPLNGTGVSTTLTYMPSQLDFRNVVVGTTKGLVLTLTNESEREVRVDRRPGNNARPCADAGSADFCFRYLDVAVEDDSFMLAPGAQARVEAQFSPRVAGTPSRGDLVFAGCSSAACEVRIPLIGRAVEAGMRCEPSRLDFGQVNPGSQVVRSFTCENIANAPVTLLGWQLTGDSDPAFSMQASQPRVLAEGASVTVEATYAPTALGDATGTARLETDDPNPALRTVDVALQGSGGGPEISVIPQALEYGRVSLIAPSRRNVVIANTGFAPLIISEIQMDVDGTNAFSSMDAGATALQPGETTTFTVEFTPRTEGRIESSLRIVSNDADEPTVSVGLGGDGVNLPPCVFSIVPQRLNFGAVQVTRSLRRAFEIRNEGRNLCLVTGIRAVTSSSAAFSLPEGDIVSAEIPPGGAKVVPVEFAPLRGTTYTAEFEIGISSPTSPFNRVSATGVGADTGLLVVPRELDFGTIGVGCSSRNRAVTLYNTGTAPIQINAITLDGVNSAFGVLALPSGLPASPFNLAAGQSATFEVRFTANAVSEYASAVKIDAQINGVMQEVFVGLSGEGATDATQVDEFAQLGKPKVDILFVVDKTTSMTQEQDSLAANFGAFLQFANAQALDYHIASTTTNTNQSGSTRNEAGRITSAPAGTMRQSSVTGPPANRVVTPRTQPTPEAVFGANVSYQLTGGPPNEESGLRAAELAFSAPAVTGQNAAFLRPDAVLSLIIVSDAQDHSPQPVDFYINFFRAIKGFRNTNLFSASAVAAPQVPGQNRSTCNGPGGNAYASGRYAAVVQRTGGVFVSICTSDWSRALEDLSQTAFGFKSRFFLTNQPETGTLRVFVDGVELPATATGGGLNWSYDLPSNSINFASYSTPEPGSQIRAEYTAECL